jgi:hypothetical protein
MQRLRVEAPDAESRDGRVRGQRTVLRTATGRHS